MIRVDEASFPSFCSIGKQIEEKARQAVDSFGQILEKILPVHVLSFWEAEEFHIWFSAKVYPVKAGESLDSIYHTFELFMTYLPLTGLAWRI